MSTGIVKEVMGAVVDITFPAGQLPGQDDRGPAAEGLADNGKDKENFWK